ncbi:MAG: M14 family metallopeptidase [Phycisphaera sp.]|nr:MAG: M14 family metallopeptidase [Phycisphaera sp.]
MRAIAACMFGLSVCVLAPLAWAQGTLTAADVSPNADLPYDYFDGLHFDPAVPTPEGTLGYKVGERFTRHADRVAYSKALAEGSDRVRFAEYGRSHQQRPLVMLTISSPDNLERLDEIIAANKELADPDNLTDARRREIVKNNPAIVWYSFGVHGNEASCGEISMQFAYTLAAAVNDEMADILDNCVFVVDPQVNPDGQSRYVAWYENATGQAPDPNPSAFEHDEPWPSGRSNHYLFDLNRDLVWGVHPESRARLAAIRRYLPQLHLDYHEQGYHSPYFFGEGDKPYNKNIPQDTKDWIALYGRENARAFDKHGIVYATRERFDYLYPGYGKVLPVYHGAIGLLLEKAGHGRAGLAIRVSDQYILTLAERVRDHLVTAMSYAETTAANREVQLDRFAKFWRDSVAGEGPGPKAFAISADNDPAVLKKVWDFCLMHGIRVDRLTERVTTGAFATYDTGELVEDLELPEGTWVIGTNQPMTNLVRTMFERVTEVEDPDTYDITAWSLPISFGVEGWWSDQVLSARTERVTRFAPPTARLTGSGGVALLIDSSHHNFPVAVGQAVEHDIFCRVLGSEVQVDGKTFAQGSLLVHLIRNPDRDLEAFVRDVLASGVSVHRASEGFTASGPMLGNNANPIMRLPKVLLATGPSVNSLSAGQHWHMLEINFPFPHTRVDAGDLGRMNLSDYSVIVLPSMGGLSGTAAENISDWVRRGGAVVASDSAAGWALREIAGAERERDEQDGDEPKANTKSWEDREQASVARRVAGAMGLTRLDTSHPLTAGLRDHQDWMGVLVRGMSDLPMRDDAYVVARYDEEQPIISGPVSERNQDRMAGEPFIVHHRVGGGAVIVFADDVTIRGFHHAGMRMLMNAIVYGPTLSRF